MDWLMLLIIAVIAAGAFFLFMELNPFALLQDFLNLAMSLVGSLVGLIGKGLDAIGNGVVGIADKVADGVTNIADKMADGVTNIADRVSDGVTSLADTASSDVKNSVVGTADQVSSGFRHTFHI